MKKTRILLTLSLLSLTMTVSAQVQLLYLQGWGRNVIDRNKKLYWMEGDDDPCYDILNYRKTGNKETFNLKSKEQGSNERFSVVMTLNANTQEPTAMTISGTAGDKKNFTVKTTSGDSDEDARMKAYFNKLAGNPVAPSLGENKGASVPRSGEGLKAAGTSKTGVDKVADAAKGAFGKVKGLFKKKK